jgi:hypothetical protein
MEAGLKRFAGYGRARLRRCEINHEVRLSLVKHGLEVVRYDCVRTICSPQDLGFGKVQIDYSSNLEVFSSNRLEPKARDATCPYNDKLFGCYGLYPLS